MACPLLGSYELLDDSSLTSCGISSPLGHAVDKLINPAPSPFVILFRSYAVCKSSAVFRCYVQYA